MNQQRRFVSVVEMFMSQKQMIAFVVEAVVLLVVNLKDRKFGFKVRLALAKVNLALVA